MERVFGLPIDGLALTLAMLMGVAALAIAAVAVHNRVFLRMGLRNIRRRPARSSLIVVGLMLGTAIICAALTTGDTMGRTVRGSVVEALGQTDEQLVPLGTASKGTVAIPDAASGAVPWLDADGVQTVRRVASTNEDIDGIAPAVIVSVAVQDQTRGQNEPRVTLFATDESATSTFLGGMRTASGRRASLAQLGPDEVYLDNDAASALDAEAGDQLRILAGERLMPVRVRDIVSVQGTGSAGPSVLLPLARAQEALGRPGQVTHILVSNRGGIESGVGRTKAVTDVLGATASWLGLEVSPVKQDGLDLANAQGNAFVTMFTTFGSFSMAAGILLIFLVFVMLASERRGEMGMARAVGTQRRHLVETFLFEGAIYDLMAAAVGALLGVAVAFAMVLVTIRAFAANDLDIQFGVAPRSLLVAYGIGVLLTLAVVVVSAWRVSRLNIVSAIRDLPEEESTAGGKRRHWVRATVGLALGVLIATAGYSAQQATPFNLGVTILIASLVLVATALGATPRLAYSVAGLALVVWWLLPSGTIPFLDDLAMDMSIWIVGGLAIVIGATWVVTYNADAVLNATMAVAGRIRSLTHILKMAMAYPLRNRFRTGVTLSMFMLVVFTMVTGSTIPGSVVKAVGNRDSFGGGFDVRATTSPSAPLTDVGAALRASPSLRTDLFVTIASQSAVPVRMRQETADAPFADYVVRGVDDSFASHTTYGFAALARGYTSAGDVWAALAREPGLAVVDSLVAPRRDALMVGTILPDFALQGFFVEDGVFDPVPVNVQDPATGATLHAKVIGVLSDKTPYDLSAGLWVSQRFLAPLGERAQPNIHYFSLARGADADETATALESTFLANGMEAESIDELLDRSIGGTMTFIRLIQGFMALGLLVGVAALGVISARSVVERRQQLGVLRAIGFQPSSIRRSLLLESSFVAVTAIVIGTALALVMSNNVISDLASQAGWENLTLAVPWGSLGLVFGTVMVAALGTTWLPAVRASRVYPAEALRYA